MNRIKLVLPLIFIIHYYGLDNIIVFIVNTDAVYFKTIVLIAIISTIFYYLSSIVLYILFSKNNIAIPKGLPKFLDYWLSEIKVLSRGPDYRQTLTRYAIEISLLIFVFISSI